jgi:hypothetical protein
MSEEKRALGNCVDFSRSGSTRSPRRRVPGLRREEVAAIAGIGVARYAALENGDAAACPRRRWRQIAPPVRAV